MARLSRRRGSLKFPNGGGGQPKAAVIEERPPEVVEILPEPDPVKPLVVKKTKKKVKGF